MHSMRIPTLVIMPLSCDSDVVGRKPTTTAATEKLHLSPLATEGPKPEPITPPKPEEITAAIERGVKFLLDDQRPDGSWGSPENTKA